jgi:hypothetical protein
MSVLTTMEEPSKRHISDLQSFLESEHMGPSKLNGRDSSTWGFVDAPHNRAEDLVCIVKPEKQDAFSRWCLDKVMDAFFACGGHRFRKRDKVSGDVFYNRDKILRITYYITTALAPLLLVLSVTILWLMNSMAARLSIMAAFLVTASICLAFFTAASRSQVFGITAA